MQHAFDPEASKKSANLTANSDLLRVAKAIGINPSETFEDDLIEKVRSNLEAKWLEENKGAIETNNARIEKNCVFGAHKRRF